MVETLEARTQRWESKHPRLWCRDDQSYESWHRDGYDNIICSRCGRNLIAFPLFEEA